mmetsp:Transcript_19502/g.54275  ORF Transcript_19502/g.54275 Transcript_19502/m.54275 type:complete len:206 (+) Transcript_19502:889-1506(+)
MPSCSMRARASAGAVWNTIRRIFSGGARSALASILAAASSNPRRSPAGGDIRRIAVTSKTSSGLVLVMLRMKCILASSSSYLCSAWSRACSDCPKASSAWSRACTSNWLPKAAFAVLAKSIDAAPRSSERSSEFFVSVWVVASVAESDANGTGLDAFMSSSKRLSLLSCKRLIEDRRGLLLVFESFLIMSKAGPRYSFINSRNLP